MSLRNRLFALVGAAVALTVVLVTSTVSSSARRAFAAVDAQRRPRSWRSFAGSSPPRANRSRMRLERIAASDAILRMAAEIGQSKADFAPYVGEAAPLAAAQALDFLDLVADRRHDHFVRALAGPVRLPASVGAPRRRAPKPIGARSCRPSSCRRRRRAGPDRRPHGGGGRASPVTWPAAAGSIGIFSQSLVLPAGMRVLLYRNLEPEVSRQQLVDASGRVADAAPLEPLIARVRQSGQEARETIDWPDGRKPSRRFRSPAAMDRCSACCSSAARSANCRRSSSGFDGAASAFGALGIVFGFALSYVVASRVTRPVEQLADAARAVAGGDWDVQVDHVRTSGEIAALAERLRHHDAAAGRSARSARSGRACRRVARARAPARARAEEPAVSAAHHARQPAARQVAAGGRVRRGLRARAWAR